MAVKKRADHWLADIYPEGRNGPRIRKKFPTKHEAQRFEAFVKSQADKGEPWNPKPSDSRKLTELVTTWYNLHGKHLKDGDRRHTKLLHLVKAIGNPPGQQFKPGQFLTYRARRIEAGISAKTLNNELGYLNAVFNELHRTQQVEYSNPLASVRPIKIAERELSYLTTDQIQELLDSIDSGCENPHVAIIARVCLATGARWGEGEGLRGRDVTNGRVTFTDTKSGKNRSVPIEPELFNLVKSHLKQYQVMNSAITSFRRALDRCSFTLPKGQASHVLRHSFASHFIMNGGDILTLQKILGHSSLVMTMRYAHLAPEHLNYAIKFNPLSSLRRHLEDFSEAEKEKTPTESIC